MASAWGRSWGRSWGNSWGFVGSLMGGAGAFQARRRRELELALIAAARARQRIEEVEKEAEREAEYEAARQFKQSKQPAPLIALPSKAALDYEFLYSEILSQLLAEDIRLQQLMEDEEMEAVMLFMLTCIE